MLFSVHVYHEYTTSFYSSHFAAVFSSFTSQKHSKQPSIKCYSIKRTILKPFFLILQFLCIVWQTWLKIFSILTVRRVLPDNQEHQKTEDLKPAHLRLRLSLMLMMLYCCCPHTSCPFQHLFQFTASFGCYISIPMNEAISTRTVLASKSQVKMCDNVNDQPVKKWREGKGFTICCLLPFVHRHLAVHLLSTFCLLFPVDLFHGWASRASRQIHDDAFSLTRQLHDKVQHKWTSSLRLWGAIEVSHTLASPSSRLDIASHSLPTHTRSHSHFFFFNPCLPFSQDTNCVQQPDDNNNRRESKRRINRRNEAINRSQYQ